MNTELLSNVKEKIDHAFTLPYIDELIKKNRTRFINTIGKNMGIEQMSLDDPILYGQASEYINKKIEEKQMKNATSKTGLTGNIIKELFNESVLKETSFEIPTPRQILRYEEDDVVKTIKEIIKKQFSNVTVEQIKGEEGGAFYTTVFSLELENDIKNDLERKRFYIMQVMAKFKAQFCAAISAILPVINMNTGSYEFTKNSSKLKFGATICLSHTNDRDWVSGVYRGPEEKKKKEIADYDNEQDRVMSSTKSMIKENTQTINDLRNLQIKLHQAIDVDTDGENEPIISISINDDTKASIYLNGSNASIIADAIDDLMRVEQDMENSLHESKTITEAPRQHAIKPIKLATAIQMYNSDGINQKMLETAIKACGRSELEFYVLRSVGINTEVDISDVDSKSTVKEDDDEKDTTKEDMNEATARFAKADFSVEDAFKTQDELRAKGLNATARTANVIVVKWPVKNYTAETIAKTINGKIISSQ